MTDTEQERIKAICKVAHIDDISDLSDGYHTFKQLYYQRMMLFAVIVKQNRDNAWKSLRHEDGELCFGGGWFIVGIDTPKGSYTYHYEDKYFSLFDCVELERGKTWDGHTEKDVTRLLSLEQEPCEDCVSRDAVLEALYDHEYKKDIRKDIEALPSVYPKQRMGQWIDEGLYAEGRDSHFYRCSECGFSTIRCKDERPNYCPDCGAKMQEVNE